MVTMAGAAMMAVVVEVAVTARVAGVAAAAGDGDNNNQIECTKSVAKAFYVYSCFDGVGPANIKWPFNYLIYFWLVSVG